MPYLLSFPFLITCGEHLLTTLAMTESLESVKLKDGPHVQWMSSPLPGGSTLGSPPASTPCHLGQGELTLPSNLRDPGQVMISHSWIQSAGSKEIFEGVPGPGGPLSQGRGSRLA